MNDRPPVGPSTPLAMDGGVWTSGLPASLCGDGDIRSRRAPPPTRYLPALGIIRFVLEAPVEGTNSDSGTRHPRYTLVRSSASSSPRARAPSAPVVSPHPPAAAAPLPSVPARPRRQPLPPR